MLIKGDGILSNINYIQSAIMQLEGGAFQKLFDQYLYKKYKFTNIQTLGVQAGTNKPTKGIPDSYVMTDDGKYILINYGSVNSRPKEKIKEDIIACFDKAKLSLPKDKIKKIICGHSSTNIHIEQLSLNKEIIQGVNIELIGIDTLSHDLALIYPHIAKDMLGIAIDTNQFFDIEDFVKAYDANGINAPIDCKILHRDSEINEIFKSINENIVTILIGPSGIGKTRLALEVCRRQDKKDIKIYCIKSNGNLLYEDIKYYIDEPGNYLLFFDDANMVTSFDNVLNTILTLPNDYKINVLITVRDYARERVIKKVSRYSKPSIIKIRSFKDDEITDILKNNLGIINTNYLKKITSIANGNIRLAFLAGIRSINDGYKAIHNAEDIFENYYGYIIDDVKLTKNDVIMLFFIAVAGPVKSNGNQLYNDLKNTYGNEIDEKNIIENLYYLELIDWFKNEITKISDQSFGNYILYYVLFKKKWVSVESLINIGFPNYRNKVIYVLNTLMEIFGSKELQKYLKESIISAWNNAPIDQNMQYLESFYQIEPDKALYIIKKHIDQENVVIFDLDGFDINDKKKYHKISSKEIEILGGYKYTDNFEDALDLLIFYYAKRPDLIMDFYFVLTENFLYDRYSNATKYNHELCMLDKLWAVTEKGENYNNSILYLHISEYALKTEISFTESIRNSHSVNFVRMPIEFTEEIAVIRANILKNLGCLRKYAQYKDLVNEILLNNNINGLSDEESSKYLKADFDIIYTNIIDKDKPDFYDAKIVARYKKIAEQIGITTDEHFQIFEKNIEYRIYDILNCNHKLGQTIDDAEKIHRERILKEVKSYKLCNYRKLFAICNSLERKLSEREKWTLNTGLDYIFENLEEDSILYIDVIKEYFNENAPLRINGCRQIKYLIDNLGYQATYDLVINKMFDKKDEWLLLIWECLPEESISEKAVNDYKEFVLNNLNEDRHIIPEIQIINRYGEKDNELKAKVIEKVVNHPEFSNAFLGSAYKEEDIKLIFYFFRDNIETLATIYMNAIRNNIDMDYNGKLFIKIFEQQPAIWNEYVDFVKDNIYLDGYENKMFDLIWNVDKWRECIDYAYMVLIDDDTVDRPARLLFRKTQDCNVFKRKKDWLIDKLHKYSLNFDKCRKLILVVVTVLPECKLEFIIEFLKDNKNIEDFKKIYLFPMSCSWSGSEVPLILKKIEFLKLLKDSLKGIDYIEHRKYLEELCMKYEKYKEEVELREYIEDADYA